MNIRRHFPAFAAQPGLRFLDNAATAQVPEIVLDAMRRHDAQGRGNVARGQHRLAERADRAYDEARHAAARFLSAAPAEIVFTSGTTAAINLLARALPLAEGDEIVASVSEHHANLVPWRMRGARLRLLPITGEGRLDLSRLDEWITPRCRLVALTHASNVTGALTDVATVVEAARAVGAPVLLDGAQAAPHGPRDVSALGVDFYAFSGHKCFGPTGIGVLWGRAEQMERLPPAWGGGGMVRRVTTDAADWAPPPRRFEAGTPPITQAIGLGVALDWMGTLDWPAITRHEAALTARLRDGLGAMKGVRLLGPSDVPIVSFTIRGIHPHDLCQVLDGLGLALRGGHFCAQPLLAALGAETATRASLALYNDQDDVEALLAGIAEARRVLA